VIISDLKEEAQQNMTRMKSEIEQYSTQTEKLSECIKQTLLNNQERALEIAKIEAFDQWLSKEALTKEHITAQQLFDRVVTRIDHMFKTLQNELRQARSERDELQERLEKQDEYDPLHWEKLLGYNQIEDPANMIAATMKNLAPPISIYQYYQAYKPLILKWSDLPDLRNQSQISA
jgi:hypothetical protein